METKTRKRKRVRSPLKWHGGKCRIAAKIVAMMPPHIHYVEPFAGGLQVLFAKDPTGVSEVVNDTDGRLSNFWRVLQCPEKFAEFHREIEMVPFSEYQWCESRELFDGSAAHRAARFFVRCRQSLAARMDTFASITRNRLRRGINEQAAAWLSAIDQLPAVHARLKTVVVLCHDGSRVIEQQDGPQTLFYLDPPYLGETRTSPNVYAHEMSDEQHAELLDIVRNCKGKVMLSGYPSTLYNNRLADWNRHVFQVSNHASRAPWIPKRKMSETVWCNF